MVIRDLTLIISFLSSTNTKIYTYSLVWLATAIHSWAIVFPSSLSSAFRRPRLDIGFPHRTSPSHTNLLPINSNQRNIAFLPIDIQQPLSNTNKICRRKFQRNRRLWRVQPYVYSNEHLTALVGFNAIVIRSKILRTILNFIVRSCINSSRDVSTVI